MARFDQQLREPLQSGQRQKLFSSSHPRLALFLFIVLIGPLSVAVCVELVTLLVLLFRGGMDLVLEFWRLDGKRLMDLVKWPVVFLGIPLGMGAGYFLWHWMVVKTGLVTEEEIRKMWGR